MDLKQIIQLFLKANPTWSKKIESFTGQPIDYSIKCIDGFLVELNKGPGIKSMEDKRQIFNSNYQLVMGLGCFKDYEAQILAADISGFSLAEITQHFRINLHWDTNVDEVESIYKELVPKFKDVGKRVGLFKDHEDPFDNSTNKGESIPNLGGKPAEVKHGDLAIPPWKNNKDSNLNKVVGIGESKNITNNNILENNTISSNPYINKPY